MKFICKLTSLIIILSLLVACGAPLTAAYAVKYNNDTSYTCDDIDTLIELMAEQDSKMDAAHKMAEGARQLGYGDDHEVIVLAKEEWASANATKIEYLRVYGKLMEHWYQKEAEYPEAAYVWKYLKGLGYSDYVCAGILGNMMNEVGGNTLALQPMIVGGSSYYGICQWSRQYSDVWGTSLEGQCEYLENTIVYELNTFGGAYKYGFNYDKFVSMTDVRQVALAFAKCYERCGSGSYSARQKNAVTAYNYFVG